jgi:hypothetical protein
MASSAMVGTKVLAHLSNRVASRASLSGDQA